MKYGIVKHTTQYRGDHEAEIAIYIKTKDGETIEGLIERVKLEDPLRVRSGDYLEIHILESGV
jgi:hypothetical protein